MFLCGYGLRLRFGCPIVGEVLAAVGQVVANEAEACLASGGEQLSVEVFPCGIVVGVHVKSN